MPTPPLSPELCQQAWDAFQAHGTKKAAAAALGLPPNTFDSRLNVAKSRGLHLSPGVSGVLELARLAPNEAQGGWLHSYDGDGKKVAATYWRPMAEAQEDMISRIRAAIEGMAPAPVFAAPEYVDADLLTVYPIADRHNGMRAWGRETGEDYDSKIASARLIEWMGRCVASAPASAVGVVLDIGDGEHINDATNQTPKSKHPLDADGRLFMTLETSVESLCAAVELALTKHERVIARILPGNHNPTLYLAVMFAVAERYREHPRVKVQKVPGEYWVHQHGKVMLAAHHGDKAKAPQLVHFFADEYAPIWGKTRHRVVFTGHMHHEKTRDIGGMTHEQLRAVSARDAYAVSHAYSARAQLQAITYDKERGEIHRVKVGQ